MTQNYNWKLRRVASYLDSELQLEVEESGKLPGLRTITGS